MASAATLLDDIREYISTARELLAAGREADLAGMDTKAAELEQAVRGMSEAERSASLPKILEVMEELSALEQQLRGRSQEVQAELVSTANVRKAHNAYLSAPAAYRPPAPDEGEE